MGIHCCGEIFFQNEVCGKWRTAAVITNFHNPAFTTLRPRQNGRHFPDDVFKIFFLKEYVWFPIAISLKFVPEGPFNNIPILVQTMVWRRPGDKSLSAPMLINLLTHIYAPLGPNELMPSIHYIFERHTARRLNWPGYSLTTLWSRKIGINMKPFKIVIQCLVFFLAVLSSDVLMFVKSHYHRLPPCLGV